MPTIHQDLTVLLGSKLLTITQMKTIKDFEVVGSSKRCIILNIDGRRVFCSTSNYATLCMNPNTSWDIQLRPEHEDRHSGAWFPAQYWIAVYRPHFI